MTSWRISFSATLLAFANPTTAAVTFDWAIVGNPGNNPDPYTSTTSGGPFGRVDSRYHISKFEVTNQQYAEFLNSVQPTGGNGTFLYNPSMGSQPIGGINFNLGAPAGSKYAVKLGMGSMPVVFVSWPDAARFVNWLHNGQGNGSTESGVYDLTSAWSAAHTRAPNATYFIPTENEWYKAAYHQPTTQGGDTDDYWMYPTTSNSEPNSDQPPGDPVLQSNVANFYRLDGSMENGYNDGFAVGHFSGMYLSEVGAYVNSSSFYGTFDQGGNAWEITESTVNVTYHVLRGGSWYSDSRDLYSGWRVTEWPNTEDGGTVGFRVASIPEPSYHLLYSVVAAGAFIHRTRRSANAALS